MTVAVFESHAETIKRLFILNNFFKCRFYDLKIDNSVFVIVCGAKE